jgi:hypothetical protein
MRPSLPLQAFPIGFLCLWAVACSAQGGEPVGPGDAAITADRPLLGGSGGNGSGGNGNGGSAGGAGGQTIASGGAGGGSSGGAGAGGTTTQGGSSGKRDAAAGAGGRDARTSDATSSGGTPGSDGSIACDDMTSPGRLGVYYYSNSTATGSSIQMYFDLVNFTAYSAQLSQVTIRYWFTDEGASSPNEVEQYYVPIPTTLKFTKLNPPRDGADTVLELAFAGAGDAGASFVETRGFNFAFHKASYAGTYDQRNDYSYDPNLKTALGPNPKITAYIKGELAWGCEPGAAPPAIDGGAATADVPPASTTDAARGEAGR